MTQNHYVDDVGSILSKAITSESAFVVDPASTTIPDVVSELLEAERPPAVNLLAGKDEVKAATTDFMAASHVADLVADGTLSIRVADDVGGPSLVVSEDIVVSLVRVPDRVAGLAATDAAFVTDANEHYATRWAEAERFKLNTPPLSRVRETLDSDLGTAVAEDFDVALAELPAVRRDGDGLGEVTVSLLVAARHGLLLYDVSRWGEQVGLASKATYSRTKGELEEAGLVTTEKVPVDVGRPRLRLRLATGRLRGADVPELARLARERTGAAEE
jgi:hypothetical protein